MARRSHGNFRTRTHRAFPSHKNILVFSYIESTESLNRSAIHFNRIRFAISLSLSLSLCFDSMDLQNVQMPTGQGKWRRLLGDGIDV